MKQFVQGDILFIEVDKIPREAQKDNTKIVARGEKTGHTHSLFGVGSIFIFRGAPAFLQADQDLEIRHDEHPPLQLPKGNYEIRQQRVFDYAAVQPRPVED